MAQPNTYYNVTSFQQNYRAHPKESKTQVQYYIFPKTALYGPFQKYILAAGVQHPLLASSLFFLSKII